MTGKPAGKHGCTKHSKRKLAAGLTGLDALCDGWAIKGSNTCRLHGHTKRSRAVAAQRVEAESVRRECEKLGIPIEIDPADGLLRQVWESAGNVAFYRAKVQQEITPDAHAAAVQEYNEERDRHVRFCALALRAGVEQKRIELESEHGALIAEMFHKVIDDPELGLNRDLRQLALRKAAALLAAA